MATLERRNTRERRTGKPTCAKKTLEGAACRATVAWKCTACTRLVCGVHISRSSTYPLCPFCRQLVVQLRQRANKRRATDRAMAEPVDAFHEVRELNAVGTA